jgi:hypothetical protein
MCFFLSVQLNEVDYWRFSTQNRQHYLRYFAEELKFSGIHKLLAVT